jgi:hypothetical protein
MSPIIYSITSPARASVEAADTPVHESVIATYENRSQLR